MNRNASLLTTIVMSSLAAAACAGTDGDATTGGAGAVAGVTLKLTAAPGQSGVVHYALKNDSSQTVHVLRWKTPLDAHADTLFGVQQDGKEARYKLENNRRTAAPGPNDYIELLAGHELTADIALAPRYDLGQGGKFEVRSVVTPNSLVAEAAEVSVNSDAKLSLEIDTKKDSAGEDDRVALSSQKLFYSGCSDDQIAVLNYYLTWIFFKTDQILNNYNPDSAHNLFWFGQTDGIAQYIQQRTIGGIKALSGSDNLELRCDASHPSCEGTKFLARAQGTDAEPSMLLCSEFWNIDPNEQADTQLETVIHELSHFMDTSDNHYGVVDSHQAALTSPYDASTNADNYGYFYVCQAGICGE